MARLSAPTATYALCVTQRSGSKYSCVGSTMYNIVSNISPQTSIFRVKDKNHIYSRINSNHEYGVIFTFFAKKNAAYTTKSGKEFLPHEKQSMSRSFARFIFSFRQVFQFVGMRRKRVVSSTLCSMRAEGCDRELDEEASVIVCPVQRQVGRFMWRIHFECIKL
jgi:hypothetical protein